MASTRALYADIPDLRHDLIHFHMIPEDLLSSTLTLPRILVSRHSARIAREHPPRTNSLQPPEPFHLSNHPASVLTLFPSFCLTGKIHSSSATSPLTTQQVLDELNVLSEAWELAAYLESPTFRDAVVDAMHAVLTTHRAECSHYSNHENVLAVVGAESGMGRLLLDHVIWGLDIKGLRGVLGGEGLLGGALASRSEAVEGEGLVWGDLEGCGYHGHGEGGECYREMFPR